MELTLLLVADYASATMDGKLYMMGVFNRIHAVSFPATHPDMYLVVQLSASPFEYGRNFKLDIKLVDDDMQPVIALTTDAIVPHSESGDSVTLNHILKLVNVVFPKPGTYEFAIQIDQDLKGTPLRLELIQISLPQS